MRITKITTEWEDGKSFSIVEPDVTEFLEARGWKDVSTYLWLTLARNLKGGFRWIEEKRGE